MKTPPLILGAALLFWSWQTGYWFFGPIMALMLEGSRLIKRRWDLSSKDFHRISDLSAIIFMAMVAYRYLADTESMLRWLPMGIFPLILAQAFSSIQGVDMGALFYAARQREKKGLVNPRRTVDMSYPVLGVIVLSASAANIQSYGFYLGAFMIIAWVLWANRPRRFHLGLWAGMLILAGLIGWAGQVELHRLHVWVEKTALEFYTKSMEQNRDPFQNVTSLGDIGEIKLSNHIVMRVKTSETLPSGMLLHQASYNKYRSTRWLASGSHFIKIPAKKDGMTWRLGPDRDPHKLMIISKSLSKKNILLSRPLGSFVIKDLPVASLEQNRFGAIRAGDGPGLINYEVSYDPGHTLMSEPDEYDLTIPAKELDVVMKIAGELGLENQEPEEVIKTVKNYFQDNFQYSLKLRASFWGTSPINRFLTKTRSGHCEFFATASVFILRAAGIPARYSTGYLVDEFSSLEKAYIIRGRHAHSWASAYVDGAWVDVDSTPVVWVELEKNDAPRLEPFYDLFRWLGFIFSKWRWSEKQGNYQGWLLGLTVFLIAFLSWRILFRKRTSITLEKMRAKKSKEQREKLSAFYEIEKAMAQKGFARHSFETQNQWINRMEEAGTDPAAILDLKSILPLHYRLRFDPSNIQTDGSDEMNQKVKTWLDKHAPT